MFTGIVEDCGVVSAVDGTDAGIRLTVSTRLADGVDVGESIAVNGVCLTAVHLDQGRCGFDVVPETLRRSNLGSLQAGDLVNLERAMPSDGRFDGHIVQGHVDGRGLVSAIESDGEGSRWTISVDDQMLPYLVEKGSVTVNGVSLTVAAVTEEGFSVALIPHTLAVTNLGKLGVGATVNLEADVIAKYVERIMESRL